MGGARLEENSWPGEPCYWLPSFKALLECHLLLEAFLDSSLAPRIKRSHWGAWLLLLLTDLGWPGAAGRAQAGPHTG